MFGCRIRDNQYRYNPEKSSRKKILTLERCSEDKVEKLRRDCILLANRYLLLLYDDLFLSCYPQTCFPVVSGASTRNYCLKSEFVTPYAATKEFLECVQ